ncbi:MAG TPA: ABC transporter permease [Mycobacteriales bacterium]|jgi:ABC transporter DrrB family efflux protein|nr:ABC transporter permease [Mycobacteriales bacterium]
MTDLTIGQKARFGAWDAYTLTRRNLTIWLKVPAFIAFTVIQPVMFTLLFRYVFGGAIHTGAQGGYVDFLLPGVIGQTAAFTSFGTAISLAQEVQKGSIDRLRSMPIARSAVLLGRLAADVVRLLVITLIIVGVGYLVGFRFYGGFGGAVGMIVLALVLGVATCCVSAFIGLAIKDEESVQAFGLIWVFPLTFVSSAFVPVQTMPGWLQAFANNQPITQMVDAMRALALGTPVGNHVWAGLLWMLGVLAVFGPLAVRAYRRAS